MMHNSLRDVELVMNLLITLTRDLFDGVTTLFLINFIGIDI